MFSATPSLALPLPLAGRPRPGCAHKRCPGVVNSTGGRWSSPALFNTEELLQQAETLLQAGQVAEAEAVMRCVATWDCSLGAVC